MEIIQMSDRDLAKSITEHLYIRMLYTHPYILSGGKKVTKTQLHNGLQFYKNILFKCKFTQGKVWKARGQNDNNWISGHAK